MKFWVAVPFTYISKAGIARIVTTRASDYQNSSGPYEAHVFDTTDVFWDLPNGWTPPIYVADAALRRPLPEPSPSRDPSELIDMHTVAPTLGPEHDARTYQHVDRIANSFERLDRAEALRREREARKTLGDEE